MRTRLAIPLVWAASAGALLLSLLGFLCFSGDSRADDTGERAIGYDHVWHEGQVSVAGSPAIPCERCHSIIQSGQLGGRPDHASCYGDCHGPAPERRLLGRPYVFAEVRARQCRTCHTPRSLTEAISGGRNKLTVAYPPYRRDPDHGVRISHAVHDEPARAGGQDCVACHPAVGTAVRGAADPHARCAACHGRAVDALAGGPGGPPSKTERMAPMTECGKCHEQAYGPRTSPNIEPGTYSVTQTFSHRRHGARSPLACRQCHGTIASAEGTELSPPAMDSCASCHDGQQAFATTGTQCRRCHTARSAKLRMRPDRLAHFSHRDHEVKSTDCRTCHRLDASGRPRPTTVDHQPCANQGCHRDQFASLSPTICTTCHLGTEPWRALHFDRPPAERTEFGARFSHTRHMGAVGMQRQCRDCHRRTDQQGHLRLPRDHDACQGSGCHGAKSGPAPTMTECSKCHAASLLSRRDRRRLAARWTVRARFRHDTHERDPRTDADAACTDCHRGVDQAATIGAIPTPTKATCQKCHDGQVAFKVTGHGCAKCHDKSSR